MNFEHVNLGELQELKVSATDKGRFYHTPEGNVYPSVTTVIGTAADKTWLEDWRKRVGDEEVAKVSAQAARRGTAVHDICEKYLRNDPHYLRGHMPANIGSFNSIKSFLDENITKIGGLEIPLYSNKLKVAGRVDCLAMWKNTWSIVDFKTSKRTKRREDIDGYFMQASCYAAMVYERLNIIPRRVIIVMTVDDAASVVYEENSRDWLPKFIEVRKSVDISLESV